MRGRLHNQIRILIDFTHQGCKIIVTYLVGLFYLVLKVIVNNI